MVIEKLEPYIKNARKRIISSSKYYFFDIGVRNAAADAPLDKRLTNINRGILFEHFVILELFRRKRILNKNMRFYYWRTQNGNEVDLVVEYKNKIIPFEIKASKDIRIADLSGLTTFMKDYDVDQGYVITLDLRPNKISDKITAIPWNYL